MIHHYQRSVLMGDPACFDIQGGANPHTRDKWGRRKKVDKTLAMAQWQGLAGTLIDLGVKVYVIPAMPHHTGLVFPANAGFLTRLYEPVPVRDKTFFVSRSVPTRQDERDVYVMYLRALGFRVELFPSRFEGEADFFPVDRDFIFTSGPIKKQRFVLGWGWPPFKRVYGFRSASKSLSDLRKILASENRGKKGKIQPLSLRLETHYHGDTCLCAFGKNREFLMAYLPALSDESQGLVREVYKEQMIELSDEDGMCFSANSFQVDCPEPVLVMPHTASVDLRKQVHERGVRTVTVNVSEFMSKGGGSVKCMIGDLGVLSSTGRDVSDLVNKFRDLMDYKNMFKLKK